ncbi:alpha/beta fold hydrolase [Actinoplanes sp. NPDC024001]|uniref:alpha/beta fold hydrolase n=1 Tax=Actinoplanes sp. NPDC024001 TaxID=3154598 RepID=UPI00340AD0DD
MTVTLDRITLRNHSFEVPLDHADPDSAPITFFVREAVANDKRDETLPYLVFLPGGPGYPSPRSTDPVGWLGPALERYRVLLPDYRGTGLSSPVGRHTTRGRDAQQIADHLAHYRADSIVRDLETVRPQLTGGEPWSLLGQSYGGFCAVSYLSFAPAGVREAFLAGGLPPLGRSADEVYRATCQRVLERNDVYFSRYPEDRETIGRICTLLRNSEILLPDRSRLTVERFQHVGIIFGYSYGIDQVHYAVEHAFAGGDELSDKFLFDVYSILSYIGHPLYAVLHESIYADGNRPSRWAAARALEEFPALSPDHPAPLFTGETMTPGLFHHDPELVPFRDAAEILAQRTEWPPLYDFDALKSCTVPTAAAIYVDDMYVDRTFSEETARLIPSVQPWITNEFLHDGLTSHSDRVLARLFDMMRNRAS